GVSSSAACPVAGSSRPSARFLQAAEADLRCRHLIGHLSDHTLIATGNGGRDNTGLTRSLLEHSICSISLGRITEGEEVAFRRCVTTEGNCRRRNCDRYASRNDHGFASPLLVARCLAQRTA